MVSARGSGASRSESGRMIGGPIGLGSQTDLLIGGLIGPGSQTDFPTSMKHAKKSAAPTGAVRAPSGTAPSSSVDSAEEAWFAGLKQSKLDWDVPPVMVLNLKRLMTVRIYGYQDTANTADALPNSTGGSPLKVSTQMSAELVSASGDDLQVVPVGAQSQKYVPATAFTDWSWNVTPVHTGKDKMLKLTVNVILDSNHSRSFVTYSNPFAVEVVSTTSAKDYVEEHFMSILKYWGPGGAGFLAIAGLIQWWRKRSKGRSQS